MPVVQCHPAANSIYLLHHIPLLATLRWHILGKYGINIQAKSLLSSSQANLYPNFLQPFYKEVFGIEVFGLGFVTSVVRFYSYQHLCPPCLYHCMNFLLCSCGMMSLAAGVHYNDRWVQ
jgi:hypothetical protein